MTNADKFKSIFGIYATELWAKSEEEFLEWLNFETEEQEKAKEAVPVEFIEKCAKAYGDKAEWIKGTEFVYAYISERVLNHLIAEWYERK